MAAGKRKERESFERYRERLSNEQRSLDMYLNGRVVHDSIRLGTKVNKPRTTVTGGSHV